MEAIIIMEEAIIILAHMVVDLMEVQIHLEGEAMISRALTILIAIITQANLVTLLEIITIIIMVHQILLVVHLILLKTIIIIVETLQILLAVLEVDQDLIKHLILVFKAGFNIKIYL